MSEVSPRTASKSAASMDVKKILLATDFSKHSQVALSRAMELAVAFQSSITAIYCMPDLAYVPSASEFGLPYNDYMLMQEEFGREAEHSMQEYLSGAVAAGVEIHSKILVGDPHLEVSHFAEKEHFDLVIAGRSGHSGWDEFFLGSTSRGLVHRSPTSVLAVSDKWTQSPKSMLACTDFSELSKAAVCSGIALSEKLGASLHLLHVIDMSDTPSKNAARMEGHQPIRQSINDYARSRLDAFVESLECGTVKPQLHLSWGTPWRETCQLAEKIEADLVVVGNAGRRGVQGFFLGNTAERVLNHCKMSVLAVKSKG